RNSSRSLVGSPPFSYAYERCVSARSSSTGSIGTPTAASIASVADGEFTAGGRLGDASVKLDDLAAVVRAADLAYRVGQLGRPALRAGRRRHPGGLPLRP